MESEAALRHHPGFPLPPHCTIYTLRFKLAQHHKKVRKEYRILLSDFCFKVLRMVFLSFFEGMMILLHETEALTAVSREGTMSLTCTDTYKLLQFVLILYVIELMWLAFCLMNDTQDSNATTQLKFLIFCRCLCCNILNG